MKKILGRIIGKIKFRDILYLIAISFSFCVFGNLFLSFFLDISDNPISKELADMTDESALIGLMISIVFIAPIIEEIIYRGFVYWLANRLIKNIIIAVIIQAILFGVSHMNLVQGIYAVAAGLLLGYLRVRYETLLASIIAHLLMNVDALLFGIIITNMSDIKQKLFTIMISLVIFILSMYRIIIREKEVM